MLLLLLLRDVTEQQRNIQVMFYALNVRILRWAQLCCYKSVWNVATCVDIRWCCTVSGEK